MNRIDPMHTSVRDNHRKTRTVLKVWPLLPVLAALVILTPGAATPAHAETRESVHEIAIEARQFSYDPPVIRVNRGEHVRLVLRSMDVTHGLSLDGYGVSMLAMPGREAQIEFLADKGGKFTFRCNQVCGNLHPFMMGSFIVEPNQPLWTAFALAGLLSLGFLGYAGVKRRVGAPVPVPATPATLPPPSRPVSRAKAVGRVGIRFDLGRNGMVSWVLRRRAFPFALLLPTLLVLIWILVAGFAGSPVGDHNLAIVLVWAIWWPFLLLVLIPLGGRVWCAVCPIPAPGEWIQRLALVRRREGRPFSLGWSWPQRLRNMWPQTLSFLTVAALSAVVSTSPVATASTLAAFSGLAILLALLFHGRRFCRHVCPLGGFIGLYSLAAPFALRVRDRQVCRAHEEKSCLEGNECGYGCPWFQYPGTMERNSDCGLCTECVKTCPRDNIAAGFQTPGRDLVRTQGRPDEAYRAIILLSAVLVYTAVMLGPWGWLKVWAGNPATVGYLGYLGLLAGSSLLVVPALLLGTAHLFKMLSGSGKVTTKQVWASFSYSLVPLGLLAWMTFAATALSTGASHLPGVISDPLGRGWDLFGTADVKWPPLYAELLPYLQVGGLLAGLAWSLVILKRRAERLLPRGEQPAWWGLVPMALLLFATTSVFMWLFLG